MNGKSASVVMSHGQQNLESIHTIVGNILHKAGCETCGRLAILKMEFVVDPTPDQKKAGALSVATEGF